MKKQRNRLATIPYWTSGDTAACVIAAAAIVAFLWGVAK